MRQNENPCRLWKLYVITDLRRHVNRSLEETVASALQGGASVIQLRDKEAKDDDLVRQVLALLKITRAARVPLIINDRIEVALRSGADGVHLGQTDAGLGEARSCLGEKAIIGRSTHSPEQALLAQREGFDYIGVGPVFGTPTKPDVKPVGLDLVRFASQNIHIPFVAIGGIDLTNIADVLAAGARTVAVVRAVMRAADPEWAAERLVEKITLNDKQKAGCEGNLT